MVGYLPLPLQYYDIKYIYIYIYIYDMCFWLPWDNLNSKFLDVICPVICTRETIRFHFQPLAAVVVDSSNRVNSTMLEKGFNILHPTPKSRGQINT